MSYNQTLWLQLNWPAVPPLAHLAGSCLKTPPFAIYSPYAAAYNCHLPHRKTDTVTHSNRTTLAEPHHCKNNFNFATQWEAVRMRRPWFLGNRHDRYVRDATFSTKESICLVTLVLCGSWWQAYFMIKITICIKTLRIIILTDEINFELHTTKQNIYTPKWKVVLLWITLSPNRWQSFSLRRSHTWTNSSWHKLFTWGGDVRTIISDRN